MKLKLLTFPIIVVVLFCSCKKEKPVASGSILSGPDACADFSSVGAGQLEYIEDSIQFKFPTFNPQNKNEIIYNFIDYKTWPWTLKLVKYNLITKQKQILIENVYLSSRPAWTNEGWIAFADASSQIYTINSDGSNLATFTSSQSNYNPEWSAIDSAIIWSQVNNQTGESILLRKKLNQMNSDIVCNSAARSPIISNDNILLIEAVGNFYYFDLKTANSFNYSEYIESPAFLAGISKGMCWHPTKPLFYVCKFHEANYGIYEINYLTGSYRKIMDFCDTKHYVNLSCSPDGNYLIGERLDRHQLIGNNGTATNNIVQSAKVYLIHIASGTETKINL